jgi:hypothetical protein
MQSEIHAVIEFRCYSVAVQPKHRLAEAEVEPGHK